MKYYTGIGSRKTPQNILDQMEIWARFLFQNGYVLRSGGAPGADQAFERGLSKTNSEITDISQHAEIYLPWTGFEEPNRTWIPPVRNGPQIEAFDIAAEFHPRWKYLKAGARKFHARNVHQVLGYDVTNPVLSDFILCWTPNGEVSGGTGQALRIAMHYDIPIYNLGTVLDTVHLLERISGGKSIVLR